MAKVVLITGAAKRIGAACARSLHQQGYEVLIHCHTSVSDAKTLMDELNARRPGSASLFQADLMCQQQVLALSEWALQHAGGVDLLINNASLFYGGLIGEVDESDWDALLGSNLKAPFFLSQALAPSLRQRQGAIINLADIHAERGLQGFPVYSIAKAGVLALTKCLAKELAPDVRVNAVAPGAILWPEDEMDEEQRADILQKIALRRCGEVDDIAKAVHFLADAAPYITGQVLNVDGGRLLFS